jgi:hypothetical protein
MTFFDACVVVPLRGEDSIEPLVSSLRKAAQLSGQRCLLVLVLNEQESTSSAFNTSHLKQDSLLDFLVMHFDQEGSFFSEKEGVGTARKIGSDFAVRLWHAGRLKRNIIYCTDADVEVPSTYFTQISYAPLSLWTFSFQHFSDSNASHFQQRATELYDLYLRYFRAGLEWAGSRYSFFAIGSILAFDPLLYCHVRGFPHRLAGEDFYFLSKATKMGHVVGLNGAPLRISGRLSERTPFGTGQKVAEWAQALEGGTPIYAESPAAFQQLKAHLSAQDSKAFHEHFDALKTWQWLRRAPEGLIPLTEAVKIAPWKDQIFSHNPINLV